MEASPHKTTEEFALSNEFATVHLKRVYSPNGSRLEVGSPRLERSVQLDPVALESLTWQTQETFFRLLEDPDRPDQYGDEELVRHLAVRPADAPEEIERGERVPSGADTQTSAAEEEFVMSNEFATIHLRRVDGRLEINSPRLQHGIRLDPIALESLTWQPPETFSGFMETPFGPDEQEV